MIDLRVRYKMIIFISRPWRYYWSRIKIIIIKKRFLTLANIFPNKHSTNVATCIRKLTATSGQVYTVASISEA